MPCEVCEKIELEILVEEEDITLDVDFAGEFISGATGEEYQKGYDEGYIKGYDEGESAGYDKGYEAGKAEGERFSLSNYCDNISFTTDEWAEENTEIHLPNATSLGYLFDSAKFTKIKVLTLTCDKPVKSVGSTFSYCSGILEKVIFNVDISQVTNATQIVMAYGGIKYFEGTPFDFSSATTIRPFQYADAIESFRVAPETIKVKADFGRQRALDDETIQSIIGGLADLTGSTTQILTVHPDVKARIEANPVWLATIVGKNWTLA